MANHSTNSRRLQAAHHIRLRSILHVSWRDKLPNKTIRERTRLEELGCIIRGKRLTWLGHMAKMNKNRRAKQVMNWSPGGKKRRGRPRKNWPETIREDLRGLELTWKMLSTRRKTEMVGGNALRDMLPSTGRTKVVVHNLFRPLAANQFLEPLGATCVTT